MILNIYNKSFDSDEIKQQEKKLKLAKEADIKANKREYIYGNIDNVSIKIGDGNNCKATKLIEYDLLAGYSWKTTPLLAPFFNGNSSIVRGKIKGGLNSKYDHTWLEIEIDGNMYVFDICFNIICPKEDYCKLFEPQTKVRIATSLAKKRLITYLSPFKVKEKYLDIFDYPKRTLNTGIRIGNSLDIHDTFYKVDARIEGVVDKDKIHSLRINY